MNQELLLEQIDVADTAAATDSTIAALCDVLITHDDENLQHQPGRKDWITAGHLAEAIQSRCAFLGLAKPIGGAGGVFLIETLRAARAQNAD